MLLKKHGISPSILIAVVSIACLVACNKPPPEPSIAIPQSDLGHIDLILDSITYNAIKNNPFVQNEFGVMNIDTMHYGGKPSYDLYVLGHLNFLHLSLAKGFWNNQEGGGVLVFQTRKPEMKDSLLNVWKQFYKDSLSVYTFKGSDFTLEEIMAWRQRDTTKPKEPYIFANLTSYSADAYRNWGITDSIVDAGLSMKRFMEDWGGEKLRDRLFHSLVELHMTLTAQESREIRSSLLATGYQESGNTFTHSFNPKVVISESEEKGKPKYSKIKIKLNRSVSDTEIVFSPKAILKMNGNESWLILN